jgi:hypothetical protein
MKSNIPYPPAPRKFNRKPLNKLPTLPAPGPNNINNSNNNDNNASPVAQPPVREIVRASSPVAQPPPRAVVRASSPVALMRASSGNGMGRASSPVGLGRAPPRQHVPIHIAPQNHTFFTEYNRLANTYLANPDYRETPLPAAERSNPEAMENDGKEKNRYFIYLPKETIDSPIGKLRCMRLPASTKLYKGMVQNVVDCRDIVDPYEAQQDPLKSVRWFSDYLTALIYASKNAHPKSSDTFCFHVTKPLLLINLMDKRNLDLIVAYLHTKIREQVEEPRPPSSYTNHRVLVNHIKTNYKKLLTDLLYPLGYILPPEVAASLGPGYSQRIVKSIEPDTKPPASPELEEEFGPQSALKRKSIDFLDRDMLIALEGLSEMLGLNLDGYYAPVYRGFGREVALFSPRGKLRHAKEDPRNGCSIQTTIRARKALSAASRGTAVRRNRFGGGSRRSKKHKK